MDDKENPSVAAAVEAAELGAVLKGNAPTTAAVVFGAEAKKKTQNITCSNKMNANSRKLNATAVVAAEVLAGRKDTEAGAAGLTIAAPKLNCGVVVVLATGTLKPSDGVEVVDVKENPD